MLIDDDGVVQPSLPIGSMQVTSTATPTHSPIDATPSPTVVTLPSSNMLVESSDTTSIVGNLGKPRISSMC